MRKVIAIIGVPGVGKTTLVRAYMDLYDDWVPVSPAPLLRAHYSPSADVYVLGVYEPGIVFAGTDRLSMAAAPAVLAWLAEAPRTVLFEGDRLGNLSTFQTIRRMPDTDLSVLVLLAEQATVEQRRHTRFNDQDATFLKGRETKVANIAAAMPDNTHLTLVETDEDCFQALQDIVDALT